MMDQILSKRTISLVRTNSLLLKCNISKDKYKVKVIIFKLRQNVCSLSRVQ